MNRVANSLPVEIGVLAIMPAVIVLLGLIFLVAAVCALVVHVLKRRTDIKFGVIGVTEDRRNARQLGQASAREQDRVDTALERVWSQRVSTNIGRRHECELADEYINNVFPIRRQAG